MSQADYMRRTHTRAMQNAQTYIMFCDQCGAYDHTLPTVSKDICSAYFFVHADCGGVIKVSTTTTHEMLNRLLPQQTGVLHEEIRNAMRQSKQFRQECDTILSNLLASERKRINTHAPERLKEFPLVIDFKTAQYYFEPEKHPRCPKCNSLLVQAIRFRTRLLHFFFHSPPENLRDKTMECLECWHRW